MMNTALNRVQSMPTTGYLCSDVTRMWFGAEQDPSTTDSTKMADDKGHEDGKGDEDDPQTHENGEEMTNGEEDDSEFDDPEGFVDDISEEGKII